MTVINIYQTSPNQKCVITRKTLSDENHLYHKGNIAAEQLAMRNLTDRAFKLYARMNQHQNNFGYALSPVEIQNSTGMSEKRYQQAVRELIDKGYMIQRKTRSNLYDFYEWPGDAADPDGVEYDGAVYEPEGTPDKVDGAPVKADMAVAESAVQPGESGSMIQQRALDIPATPGGEILQDTTFNTTRNTTMNTTMDSTKEKEFQRKLEENYHNAQDLLARRRKEYEYHEEYEDYKEEEDHKEDEDVIYIEDLIAEQGNTWSWDDDNLPF